MWWWRCRNIWILLYPDEFGPHSNLAELAQRRKDLTIGFVGVGIALAGTAALFFFDKIGPNLFYILLDVIIFFSTVFVYTETLPEGEPARVILPWWMRLPCCWSFPVTGWRYSRT